MKSATFITLPKQNGRNITFNDTLDAIDIEIDYFEDGKHKIITATLPKSQLDNLMYVLKIFAETTDGNL